MEQVIEYLKMKNKYYEKFYVISTKFLEETNQDQWENLSFFVENRERLLNIIRSLDQKIARAFSQNASNEATVDSYRETLKKLFDRKRYLGDQIIAIDLQLISRIDNLKIKTIEKLKANVKMGQHLGTFEKSSQASRRRRTKEV